MSDFVVFNNAMKKQIAKMSNGNLFTSTVSGRAMWELYLASFRPEDNPMFKERTEHDCNCCKQYVRKMGNVVSINKDFTLSTIWDVNVGGRYQIVADVLSAKLKSEFIAGVFYTDFARVGSEVTTSYDGEDVLEWEHFGVQLSVGFVLPKDSIPTKLGHATSNFGVFKRGMDELTLESGNIVKELIAQKSIYRGEEHKATVTSFIKFKKAYGKLSTDAERNAFCWFHATKLGGAAKMRNSAIGTLLTDISDEVDIVKAVKAFEFKVAPANYKRTSALITKGMIAKAQAKVKELGIADSLQRRYAVMDDITINNTLFADRSVKKAMDVFDEMASEVAVSTKKFDKVEEVGIEDFIKNILPTAISLELFMENSHTANLVSLIAPENADAPNILKWDNNYSWVYNGDMADSMREKVVAAGGRVDGVFRFTHSWNELEDNKSLMDLHVFMPTNKHRDDNKPHDSYGVGRRVGWNHRKDVMSGGEQDVDYTSAAPKGYVPVENITFPSLDKMPGGKYVCKVHNWNFRGTGGKGKAEIEFDGQLYQYVYPKTINKEWITVAVVTLKKGKFSIEHKLKPSTESKGVWGLTTNQFHKVDMAMMSPNHWDDNEIGNKHYMFMLENCLNPDDARGLYNEFLSGTLTEHRKVFDMLGSKLRVASSDQQISGLGFSSTQRNSVVCKVGGTFNRTIKINF